VLGAEIGVMFCATIRVNYEDRDNILLLTFAPFTRVRALNIQGVSGGIVNILGGGSMDYS
jgi:hypothetical protein